MEIDQLIVANLVTFGIGLLVWSAIRRAALRKALGQRMRANNAPLGSAASGRR
jgi:hypothetical protein